MRITIIVVALIVVLGFFGWIATEMVTDAIAEGNKADILKSEQLQKDVDYFTSNTFTVKQINIYSYKESQGYEVVLQNATNPELRNAFLVNSDYHQHEAGTFPKIKGWQLAVGDLITFERKERDPQSCGCAAIEFLALKSRQ